MIDEYAQLNSTKLRELVGRLTRSEQDMQERLAAREAQVHKSMADQPDPVRKRLFFLLREQRRHRRAAEKALDSTQLNVVHAPSG